jgi:hypothetical protein
MLGNILRKINRWWWRASFFAPATIAVIIARWAALVIPTTVIFIPSVVSWQVIEFITRVARSPTDPVIVPAITFS